MLVQWLLSWQRGNYSKRSGKIKRLMSYAKMLGKKKNVTRGASAKYAEPMGNSINFCTIYPFILVAILVLAGSAFYMGINTLLSKPVTRVAVTGEFRHVDRKAIARQVQPFLSQGFVRLNLQAIRDDLKARPWIYDVTISRVWPDEISINVIEQKPIARWAEVGYLNHRGNVFKPESVITLHELPLLHGPEGSTKQVMTNFQQLGEALQQQGLTLKALNVDQRGNWVATLDSQTSIVLGSTQIMEKMRRFVKAYHSVLSNEFERVQRIDMRYSNGLAVAWRYPTAETKQNKG